MAKFVYSEGDRAYVTLEAAPGEEIPVEMAAAWAAIRTSYALEQIGDNLIGVDNAITAVANAMGG